MNTTPFALSGIQLMQNLMALPTTVALINIKLGLAMWEAMLPPKTAPKPDTETA